jgi:hypothetical protein
METQSAPPSINPKTANGPPPPLRKARRTWRRGLQRLYAGLVVGPWLAYWFLYVPWAYQVQFHWARDASGDLVQIPHVTPYLSGVLDGVSSVCTNPSLAAVIFGIPWWSMASWKAWRSWGAGSWRDSLRDDRSRRRAQLEGDAMKRLMIAAMAAAMMCVITVEPSTAGCGWYWMTPPWNQQGPPPTGRGREGRPQAWEAQERAEWWDRWMDDQEGRR